MDPSGTFARPLDESLLRELPQLQSLRIAPLRQPVHSRQLSVPSPLEPNASGVRDQNSISKSTSSGNAAPPPRSNDSSGTGGAAAGGGTPAVEDANSAAASARTKRSDTSLDPLLSLEPPPPKPILPAFVNLRALERFPYSSFDEDSHARKRRRLDLHADSFGEHLQLPIPQAPQEQRPPPFGPFAILNGLNEPPPNAALLPPIEAGSITQLLTKPSRDTAYVEPALLTSNSFSVSDAQAAEKREARIEEILHSPAVEKVSDGELGRVEDPGNESLDKDGTETEKGGGSQVPGEQQGNEPMSPKTRGRSRKNVRKWTEEETTALLRGVVKCGIGNWTAILAQPELKFNKRSASNLKDRFRVCCPWAYRAPDPNEATKKLRDTLANALSRAENEGSNGAAGKIRLPHPWQSDADSTKKGGKSSINPDSPSSSSGSPTAETTSINTTGPRSTPTSSKSAPTLSSRSKSTLESLGIPEPHFTMNSRRRSRRPFTAAEDEALLKGYAVHGFQWTLIQQDKRLNLGHRRATDLRDRFRTKFPHAYRDGGSVSGNTLHSPSKGSDPDSGGQGSGLRDSEPGSKHTSLAKTGTSKEGSSSSLSSVSSSSAAQNRGRRSKRKAAETEDLPSMSMSMSMPTSTSTGPVDPALSSQGSSSLETQTGGGPVSVVNPAVFPFPLDENSNGAGGVVDASWEDNNTLAPMVWDELA